MACFLIIGIIIHILTQKELYIGSPGILLGFPTLGSPIHFEVFGTGLRALGAASGSRGRDFGCAAWHETTLRFQNLGFRWRGRERDTYIYIYVHT